MTHEAHETNVATGTMVTGATTPLGVALVEALLQDPRTGKVLAVAAEPPSEAPFAAHEDLTYLQVDLTRPRRIRKLLFGPARDLQIGTLIHTAMHRNAQEVGRRVRRLNVESTRALLHLSERHPTIRRFVFRSHAEVYKIEAELPAQLEETHPINLSPHAPQWVRDRVEADLTVCTNMGLSPLHIVVLRCAECLAPEMGSQLFDYLSSRVCFRPMGFDPMLNLLSPTDLLQGLLASLHCDCQGIFNIPGKDILPLSKAIELAQRTDIPVPGALLTPLYWARTLTTQSDFRYDLNRARFHFSGVLDGHRAQEALGYTPTVGIHWDTLRTQLEENEPSLFTT